MDMVQRIAAKAVIINDGKVLILREAASYGDGTQRGRYHLPGGRVETGEHFEDALRREIREETGLEVEIGDPLFVGEWRPVIKGTPNQIIGVFMICRAADADVKLSSEHDDFQWINPADFEQLDIMPPEAEVLERYLLLASKRAP